MLTAKDMEPKRKDVYFLLNFEQVKDFAEEYKDAEGLWKRTVLPYTIIYGIPDAIFWKDCLERRAQEIVDRYGLRCLKEDEEEAYYRF